MQRGHRARFDSAAEPVAYDKVTASFNLFDEVVKPGPIVGIVGVTHDDDLTSCSGNACAQGFAIAATSDVDDAGTTGFCNID